MPVSGSVLLLYAGAHKISLKYLFPEKMFIEICSLDSGYSLVVLGEGGGSIREDQILQFFFPNIAFYFLTTIK
jgi:hypothetical protein